ncbi:hypothetical protein FACS189465_1690 [Clostridia bacterium]|nr:hypothetical protein FACS189465_1690 [Clostridia bacterium]
MFSLHAVKSPTTAEGGAITWKNVSGIYNEEIYKKFMLLSLHGQTKDALAKTKSGNWEYDIVSPAYKCNMTDINASMGLVQLKRFPNMLKKRSEIVSIYNGVLKDENLELFQVTPENIISSNHLYIVRMLGKSEDFRNMVIRKMAEKKIATNVHYKPLPMFTAYKNMGFDIKDFKNAYEMYKNEITLPLHSLLTADEAEYIAQNFKQLIQKNNNNYIIN